MQDYKREFIEFAISRKVLKFGEFMLKSGRKSPFFFNAGLFNTGRDLGKFGGFYAAALHNEKVEFDVLFGPAYKGITIASATAIALSNAYGEDVPFCFNRKEAKAHGEGGDLVGSPLQGKIMLVDDVITAGTAIRESMQIINQHDATLAGVLIALDRQEKGSGELSAVQEVERDYSTTVYSIVTLDDVLEYLHAAIDSKAEIAAIEQYRAQFGIKR